MSIQDSGDKRLPVKRVPLRAGTSLPERPHFYNKKALAFLNAYAETLDIKAACEESGMSVAQVRKSPYMMNEMSLIEENAAYKFRSKGALGNHWRLMAKVEHRFDTGNQEERRAAMSTLARMSEAGLRAAGEFGETVEVKGIQGVQVNINIGAAPVVEQVPVIEGEIVEKGKGE